MSTAALVAAWGYRRHPAYANIPGPMQPAGSFPAQGPADPIGLTVELYLGALGWTDISPYVYYRDGSVKIGVTRGRPNEASRVQPQTASLQLNDRDGRFSPRNPNGAWYGYLGRNTPIRISRMWNGTRRYRYVGEVPSWPVTWDKSGRDVYVPIQAAGGLRRLQQGTRALASVQRRFIPTDRAPTLMAYWPCEDGSQSTSLANALPGPSMTIAGAPNLASFSGFLCSSPIPTIQADRWYGAVPFYSGSGSDSVRFLMAIPSTSSIADQTRIISIVTRGGLNRVDLLWRTGGQLQLQVFSGNNPAPVSDSGPTLLGASVNGQLLQVTVEWGPNAGGTRFFFAIQAPFTKNAFLGLLDNASLTISGVSAVAVSPDGTLSGCSVGHVYVNNVVDDFGIPSPVLDAYTTEPCYTRFTRLCQEEGLNGILMAQGVTDSNQVTMGAQLPDMLVNLMQQIADTDGGMLYEAPDQAALVYRTRLSLYNQGTAYSTRSSLVLDYAQHQLTGALDPVDDDAYTRNDVTAQRINGSFAQAVDSDPLDPLSTLAPPQGVGDYQTTYSLSIGSDNDLPDHAGWRLHLGTVNEPRYPTIRLNLRHPQFTGNVDLMNQALGLDIGDLVVIKNPPAGRGSPDDIRLIVQGYSETLGIFEHDMVLNCSPESPYRVAMLEDLVLGRADTDGSTLAAPYPLGTETTLLVATTGIQPQSPLWTTAGGDFPFDVIAGGERMTVTNITGASSPQTFTVTRSVNSVVKSQTQGTDVRLYQPMVLSL